MNNLKATISDFIVGQEAQKNHPLTVKLALALREAIREYREAEEDYDHVFSADANYEDGQFTNVRVSFKENYTMTILYQQNTDDTTVKGLYLGLPECDEELARLAGLMLSEGWIPGYKE